MSIHQKVTALIKSEGQNLSEEDMQNVIRFLNTLAKIEYEDYKQKKRKPIHGQSAEPLEIGLNSKNNAA